MMNQQKVTDITELMKSATLQMVRNDIPPSSVSNIETHYKDMILRAESCAFDLDLGRDVWLNKQRWSRLIREYLPRDGVDRFIEQAQEILSGESREGATANMMFHDPVRYEKKHRWGGCLMGATFTMNYGGKPSITFFSRTTYIGYMALLDAGIAHVMAREIAYGFDDIGLEDIAFTWHITDAQLHHFKTIPWLFHNAPSVVQQLMKSETTVPERTTLHYMWKWYGKIQEAFNEYGVSMLDYEKYGPFKRIKRRWMEFMKHVDKGAPPSCSIDTLDFSRALNLNPHEAE